MLTCNRCTTAYHNKCAKKGGIQYDQLCEGSSNCQLILCPTCWESGSPKSPPQSPVHEHKPHKRLKKNAISDDSGSEEDAAYKLPDLTSIANTKSKAIPKAAPPKEKPPAAAKTSPVDIPAPKTKTPTTVKVEKPPAVAKPPKPPKVAGSSLAPEKKSSNEIKKSTNEQPPKVAGSSLAPEKKHFNELKKSANDLKKLVNDLPPPKVRSSHVPEPKQSATEQPRSRPTTTTAKPPLSIFDIKIPKIKHLQQNADEKDKPQGNYMLLAVLVGSVG